MMVVGGAGLGLVVQVSYQLPLKHNNLPCKNAPKECTNSLWNPRTSHWILFYKAIFPWEIRGFGGLAINTTFIKSLLSIRSIVIIQHITFESSVHLSPLVSNNFWLKNYNNLKISPLTKSFLHTAMGKRKA